MRTPITNFTGGEFSPFLGGRFDVEKFHNSAQRIENFIVKPFGCLSKRPAFYYVGDVYSQDGKPTLLSFLAGRSQAYVLEFCGKRMQGGVEVGGIMRIYADGGIIVNGGTPVLVNTPYKEADLPNLRMVQDKDIAYMVCMGYPVYKLSRLTHTSWTLETVEFIGGPFSKPNEDEALTISYDGRVGIVNLTASRPFFQAYHVGEVIRVADGSVMIETVTDSTHAFGHTVTSISQNAKTGVLGDQVLSGAWTVDAGAQTTNQADKVVFNGAGKVSKTFDLYYTHDYRFAFRTTSGFAKSNKKLVVTITNTGSTPTKVLSVNTFCVNGEDVFFTISMGDKPDSTTVKSSVKVELEYVCSPTDIATVEYMDFRDKTPTRGGMCTWDFAEQAFGPRTGYPSCAAIWQQRLVFAATDAEPGSLWFSHANQEYENFDAYDAELATSGIYLKLSNKENARIAWLTGKRDLWCGTDNAVFKIYSSDSNAAFSPSTARADNEASYPSAQIEAVNVENVIMHVSRSGRMLREIAYTLEQDSWKSIQLSLFGEHMLRENKIAGLAWQSEPYGLLWFTREDGSLCCMTYMREQNVVAFHRHPMDDCVVESATVIPDDSGYDQLWIATKRKVGGVWKRFIERQSAESDRFHLDCGLVYKGVATNVVTGADHLIGETVNVIADGATHATKVVQPDGSVHLEGMFTEVHIGYPVKSRVRTHQIEQTIPNVGSLQGLDVQIVNVIMRVYDTGAALEGYRGDTGEDITIEMTQHRDSGMAMDYAPSTITGDYEIAMPGGWDSDSTFEIRHNTGTTCNILCFIAEWRNA